VADIYRYEGVRGFFKGVLSPMLGRWPMSSILFGSKEWALRKLEKYDSLNIYARQFFSGACAGICYTNAGFLFDLLKVRA